MTEPVQVDTDGLDAASAILKSAAGQIPTQLPQFSVNGSDPLSAAIRAGSGQMEAPMAALPQIKAEATTTAEKIGVAGQRYRETDEMLAQKATQQQFPTNGSNPPQRGRTPTAQGDGRRRAVFVEADTDGCGDGDGSRDRQRGPRRRAESGNQGGCPRKPAAELDQGVGGQSPREGDSGIHPCRRTARCRHRHPRRDHRLLRTKAAGYSTTEAIGQAVAREGAGTAAGLAAGGLASGIARCSHYRARACAIGSMVPGAGTAVACVGAVVGGGAAFLASKWVGSLFG